MVLKRYLIKDLNNWSQIIVGKILKFEKQVKEGSRNSGKLCEVDSVSKKDWNLRW
jgi:hypothetical protein